MEYTQLGRTGLKVSRLCLGTMNWPWLTTELESYQVMDRALDVGINFFDTADVYGGKPGEGLTEQVLGRWFRLGANRREKVVLATKVFNPMGHGPNDKGLSALHIRKACEESLKRLKTDYLDLYQFHHIDRSVPWEEIWQACELLVKEGKVLYFGSSNFAGWHIAQAQEASRGRGFMGLICEQSVYSLKSRMVELEVLPACAGYGLGFIPYSPLGGGALAGGAHKGQGKRRQHEWTSGWVKENVKKLEAYEKLCAKWKEKPADVALAWVLANPVVTAPIIGPRTLEQLDGSLRALKVKLDKKRMDELDKLFPGPGGAAPEAYAW